MEQIDLQKYFAEKGSKIGHPRFDCIKLLKIILFAFMENGYSSLRNIDIRFAWLLDDLKVPSYSTVCNFMNELLLDSIEDIFNTINSYIFAKEYVDLNHVIYRRHKTLSKCKQIHMSMEKGVPDKP